MTAPVLLTEVPESAVGVACALKRSQWFLPDLICSKVSVSGRWSSCARLGAIQRQT